MLTTESQTALVRVLLIDDTLMVRLLLRRCLELSGRFDVIGEAVDGSDGIEQADRQQPDIILLDLDMPGMCGIEAIPHLARLSPQSVIIVVSGCEARTAEAPAMAAGADAFITKSGRPSGLLQRIDAAWDGRSPGTVCNRSRSSVTGVSRPSNDAPVTMACVRS